MKTLFALRKSSGCETHAPSPHGARGALLRLGPCVLLWLAGAGPLLAQSAPEWVDRTPLPGTNDLEMAYDSARNVVVAFGGDHSPYEGHTWEWDGALWRLKATTGPSRSYGKLAYDDWRGVTVYYTGYETWEWDGRVWQNRAADLKPPWRTDFALTFDSARGVVVLFGGQAGFQEFLGDTWEWNGQQWTQRPVAGPAPRRSHLMAFDRARGVVVLAGGVCEDASQSQQTWEWNGTAWTFRASGGPPIMDVEQKMAYDAGRHATVVVSWMATWEWNGTAWARRSTVTPPQTGAMLFHDGFGKTMILNSGNLSNAIHSQRWDWSGSAWTRVDPGAPGPMAGHALVFDSARNRTLVFGGFSNPYLWEWDGARWFLREPSPRPKPLGNAALAFDTARACAVLFGGEHSAWGLYGETWEWNGTAWALRTSTGPSPRSAHAMAYDSGRGVTVLFGGTTNPDTSEVSDETWEWDGAVWTRRDVPGPSARGFHGMAYDPARGVTVLFGGAVRGSSELTWLRDTWEWDGQQWQLRDANGPELSGAHMLVHDTAHGRTLLGGGVETATIQEHQLWEWTGSHWAWVTFDASLVGVCLPLAYDARRQAVVGFGGGAATSSFHSGITGSGQIWELQIPLSGDLNCDAVRDFADIDAFLLALIDPDEYATVWPYCDWERADMNADGAVDFFDLDPFIACIVNGECP